MTAPVTGCPNCGEFKLSIEYDAANRCQVMCHECGVAGPWAQGSDEAGADAWTAFWKRFASLSPSAPGVELPTDRKSDYAVECFIRSYEKHPLNGADAAIPELLRELLALRSRLAAPAGDGWRDIASAPRDGRLVLVWWPEFANKYGNGAAVIASWKDDMYWQAGNYFTFCMRATPPTHWQPYPSAPPSGAKGEK